MNRTITMQWEGVDHQTFLIKIPTELNKQITHLAKSQRKTKCVITNELLTAGLLALSTMRLSTVNC